MAPARRASDTHIEKILPIGACRFIASSDIRQMPVLQTATIYSPTKRRLPRIAALVPFLPFRVWPVAYEELSVNIRTGELGSTGIDF